VSPNRLHIKDWTPLEEKNDKKKLYGMEKLYPLQVELL